MAEEDLFPATTWSPLDDFSFMFQALRSFLFLYTLPHDILCLAQGAFFFSLVWLCNQIEISDVAINKVVVHITLHPEVFYNFKNCLSKETNVLFFHYGRALMCLKRVE